MTKPPKKPAPKAKAAAAAAKKESSSEMSTIASKAMRGGDLTKKEIRRLGASVLGQDETKGQK